MFIYSVRASKLKLGVLMAFCVGVFILLALFVPSEARGYAGDELTDVLNAQPGDFKNIKTGEDRIRFLESYGWSVETEPAQIAEVTVPYEFDAVYEKYNQIQKGEGLDLSSYRGKTVKRYTYVITNYEYDGTVYANLLIYKDCVIGADVCSANVNGFMHGLTKENNLLHS